MHRQPTQTILVLTIQLIANPGFAIRHKDLRRNTAARHNTGPAHCAYAGRSAILRRKIRAAGFSKTFSQKTHLHFLRHCSSVADSVGAEGKAERFNSGEGVRRADASSANAPQVNARMRVGRAAGRREGIILLFWYQNTRMTHIRYNIIIL
jgi:hypothetical protein